MGKLWRIDRSLSRKEIMRWLFLKIRRILKVRRKMEKTVAGQKDL
jgi:hypothetical protein